MATPIQKLEKKIAANLDKQLFTVEEYLELDRRSREKYEYFDGMIAPVYGYAPDGITLAGASPEHSTILVNITGILFAQLRGTPCRAFSNDTKVRAVALEDQDLIVQSSNKPDKTPSKKSRKGTFAYPDLSIVCGDPVFDREDNDILLNPQVIIEIVSPTTGSFDKGWKFMRYRQNQSFTDYLIIYQQFPGVEHYVKQTDDNWQVTVTHSLENEFAIDSINCRLRLAEIYERITF